MKIKIFNEDELLDAEFRRKVIGEIKGSENVRRKNAFLKPYEILKGQTKKWVIKALLNEMEADTVAMMQNRASSIPIFKKVISKHAQTYTGGVDRQAGEGKTEDGKSTPTQSALEAMANALCLNSSQEKADRFFEAFLNLLVGVVPVVNHKESSLGKPVYDLVVKVLAPHFYDVIEDSANPEVARCVILTDFVERNTGTLIAYEPGSDGRPDTTEADFNLGDGINEIIADTVEDKGKEKRTFIWWSDKYHFTTDENGEYVDVGGVTPADQLNPIQRLPWVTYAGDQDGSYYAEGWQDRVEGAVGINVTITDMKCIAMVQGWGQPVIAGEKFPDKIKGGPHRLIVLKHEAGGHETKFYYASSNPPIDQWLRMIEQEVALFLSTNNLSPSTVAAKLDVQNMASGIAMLIERSDSTQDIQKKQLMFGEGEKTTLQIAAEWQKVLAGSQSLSEEFAAISLLPEDVDGMTHKWHQLKPVISEKEHVETLQARKNLGIDTLKDLIKKDNPEWSQDEVDKKYEELKKEKAENAQAFAEANQPLDENGKPLPPAPPKPGAPGGESDAPKGDE